MPRREVNLETRKPRKNSGAALSDVVLAREAPIELFMRADPEPQPFGAMAKSDSTDISRYAH